MNSNTPYYLGIDIGTTAVKAMIISGVTLLPVSRGCVGYPTKRSGEYVTQSPSCWRDAAIGAVRKALDDAGKGSAVPVNICGISVSAQGGALLAADSQGEALCDAISWMDCRAADESAQMHEHFGEGIYLSSGWRSSPLDCASKLVWLKKHDADLFRRADRFMTTADWITGWLCGDPVYDATSAAITRLFDFRAEKYNTNILEYIGISEQRLPRILPCGEAAGTLTPEAAGELGLSSGIPVYVGAHDQYCAAIGSGVRHPGQLLIATGTAWVLFGVTEEPCFSPLYSAPGRFPELLSSDESKKYGIMATLSGMGASVERFASAHRYTLREADIAASDALRSRLGGKLNADRYLCLTPCEEGRGFLPHRTGTGFSLDLSEGYSFPECYLSLLEGAAFEALTAASGFFAGDEPELIMSGGATKSELWSKVVASAAKSLGVKFKLTRERDTPAFGAALIAAKASGIDISSANVRLENVADDAEYTGYLCKQYPVWKNKILNL